MYEGKLTFIVRVNAENMASDILKKVKPGYLFISPPNFSSHYKLRR